MPKNPNIRKVLVIGSGPIVIGQAAEFDYAGAQACRVLHDAGVNVVLVNSNPATIMTDNAMADHIYIEPLTLPTIKRIIEKEKPDSILSGFGGQTGLTLSMQLAKEGFLKEHNVRLLGASPETIDKAEDRQMFKDTMESIGQPCIPSKVVTTVEDALEFAEEITYPVIIRPAFTLGGTGGGSETGSACADYQHITLPDKLFVRLCLGCWKIRIGDHIVVTDGGAVAAVDAFFRVDPVLCALEADGTHGTFYPAAVAAGTVLPINDICHIRFSFLVSYLYNYSNAKGGTAQISIIMLWYDLWEYIIEKAPQSTFCDAF